MTDWGDGVPSAEPGQSALERSAPPSVDTDADADAAPAQNSASAGDVDANTVEPSQEALNAAVSARVASLDAELAELQHDTRLYLGTWLAASVALTGAQAAVAMTTERREIRGNYIVGAALSAAGIGVLLAQPWAGWNAHKRYRAMRSGDVNADVRKVEFGEALAQKQRHWNHIAVQPDKHIAAGVIALASGLGVGLGFKSLKEGLSRGLGVLFILELQILTRPGTYFARRLPGTDNARPYLAIGPWFDRYAQGASLKTVF